MQEKYVFPKHVKRVCVIGAGAAGLVSAKNLRDEGLEVKVYERNAQLGGVWCYFDKPDARLTFPQTSPFFDILMEVPSTLPAKTIHINNKNSHENKVPEEYPTPTYKDLFVNLPHQIMSYVNLPFPENIPMFPHYTVITKYLIDFAENHMLIDLVEFQTSVERVRENEWKDGWKVVLRHYKKKSGSEGEIECYWREEEFDAVLVCNGHYHVPYVPEIEGLDEWNKQFSDVLYHSKYFREPNDFIDKTVLIVGGGLSAIDISRILVRISKKPVYQSIRSSSTLADFDEKTSIIIKPVIKRFSIVGNNYSKKGIIEFIDGSTLGDVDAIIFATGYFYSFPFLRDLVYLPSVNGNSNNSENHDMQDLPENKILIKNGKGVFNLYNHIFYIPNPTLSFIGLPLHVSPFPLAQFQSLFVAKVLAGKAFLPSQEKMRQESKEEESKILEILKQNSKVSAQTIALPEHLFHRFGSLGVEREYQYIDDLIEWINRDAFIGNTQIVNDEDIAKVDVAVEKIPLWRLEMRRMLASLRIEHHRY
ncbi:10787_t:CDS:2 [Ambispora gerdemannii]|uniref:10787_t:CDS:1 n=1 Tax=Ambispora gerdemannii TaxID=144530 RepID=A0A9N8ZAV9_9GLOM|nr:10787_t:CDS:2 [Ambispora gerdemannii]